MSDGGASGGFDSGSSGGTFGSGSGGGPDACGPTDPAPAFGGTGFDHTVGPGSPGRMHQHPLHEAHLHGVRHRGGGSLPTSPAGIVALVIVAIIALVVFANISSGAEDLYPGVPFGEVIDGGPVDGDVDVPTAP